MFSTCCQSLLRHTVKVCVAVSVFSVTMVTIWPVLTEAAKRRCGSELMNDLLFVCGDRGVYIGRGSWSGYGARPRGKKGIVDQCCRPGGCDLHHLEKYCNKPKTANLPSTTPPNNNNSISISSSSKTELQQAKRIEVLFQNKVLENLRAPRRDSSRTKTHNSRHHKNRYSPSRTRRNIKPR